MWGLDYAALKVGQEVAIARTGTWRIFSEGVYTVVKANKLKVVVRRNSDGYERTFSVKRKCEMSQEASYRAAYLESVEDMRLREAQYAAQRDRASAWTAAEQAARDKNLAALREAVAKLEQFAG